MFRIRFVILAVAACYASAGCTGGSDEPTGDGFDVVHYGWADSTTGDAPTDSRLPSDVTPLDTFVAPDVDAFSSADMPSTYLWTSPDLPPDLPVDPEDTWDLSEVDPDVLSPDLPIEPEDVVVVDAGPCGACPQQTPMCVEGQCVCTGSSCSSGFYCKGGICTLCNSDLHCGPECASCASEGQICVEDGTHCSECDSLHPCAPGKQCVQGTCTICEELELCGPQCLACAGKTPVCDDGDCVCDADSCADAEVCTDGICVPCTATDPAYCGPMCLVCFGTTPHCHGGECTLCSDNASCGPSCNPCSGATPHCLPSGESCVQCLDSSNCQPGFLCMDHQCIPDCQAPACTTNLSASGKKCAEAYIVGRLEAADSTTFSGDTYGDNNDDDLNYLFGSAECWDASYDHFYRFYLMAGETLTAALTPLESEFDAMLKIYTGTECDKDSAGIFSSNDDYLIECYNSQNDGKPESFSHTFSQEGWYTIVVDGRQTGDEADYGEYTVEFALTCTQDNCCCQGPY